MITDPQSYVPVEIHLRRAFADAVVRPRRRLPRPARLLQRVRVHRPTTA